MRGAKVAPGCVQASTATLRSADAGSVAWSLATDLHGTTWTDGRNNVCGVGGWWKGEVDVDALVAWGWGG